MRVLVTGGSGQLARALAATPLPDTQWHLRTMGRPEFDLTDRESIGRAIADFEPDIVVNAAAYTAVDKAESEPDAALAVNEQGARHLAELTAAADIPIIHISTDYVFAGDKDTPYLETDMPGPVNVYGQSKLAGERAVAETNPKHLILRTSWLYSPWGHNFLKTMLRLGAERDELTIVNDQTAAPTYAVDLAVAIIALITEISCKAPEAVEWGTYHLTNAGIATWYEFAVEIFQSANRHGVKSPKLLPITTDDYSRPAKRPAYTVLDNSRIEKAFCIRLRPWTEAVADCVDELMAGTPAGH